MLKTLNFISLAALLCQLASGQGATYTYDCSGGGEASFKWVVTPTQSDVIRFKMERVPSANDANCRGTLLIPIDKTNTDEELRELAPGVFANFDNLDEIIMEHPLENMEASLFENTPLKKLTVNSNRLNGLDRYTWPVGLEELTDKFRTYFYTISVQFLADNPTLLFLDFSGASPITSMDLVPYNFRGHGLKKLWISSTRMKHLKKYTFADCSLTELNMERANKLTLIDDEAFADVKLDTLNLADWQFPTLSPYFFNGASIKSLSLRASRIEVISKNVFSNLKDTESLNLGVMQFLTSIESGAFDSFSPGSTFDLQLSQLDCCNIQGLYELTTRVPTMTINGASRIICTQPDGQDRNISLVDGGDPADRLACCDTSKEYFDLVSEECLGCNTADKCVDSAPDECSGTFFTCNTCETSFYPRIDSGTGASVCTACVNQPLCDVPTTECNSDGASPSSLMCGTCQTGFFSNSSGICEACVGLNKNCLEFSDSCIPNNGLELQCNSCEDGFIISTTTGLCQKKAVSTTIIISASVGAAVGVGAITIISLVVFLYKRKKRKEKKLNEMFGIGTEQTLVLQSDEDYRAALAEGAVDEDYNIHNLHQHVDKPKTLVTGMKMSVFGNNEQATTDSQYANTIDPGLIQDAEYSNNIDPGLLPQSSEYVNAQSAADFAKVTPTVESEYSNDTQPVATFAEENVVDVDVDEFNEYGNFDTTIPGDHEYGNPNEDLFEPPGSYEHVPQESVPQAEAGIKITGAENAVGISYLEVEVGQGEDFQDVCLSNDHHP